MKILLFIMFLLNSACYAQDTVYFTVNPNTPLIVGNIRKDDNYYYIKSPNGETEVRKLHSEISKIKYYKPPGWKRNDSLRTEEYCLIIGTSTLFSTKVKISVDFGEETDFWSGGDYIRDSTGQVVKFNSMVDALNYMNSLGWQFVSAYPMVSNMGTAYHYLMRRTVKNKS